jgi:hypothetical protein
MMWWIRNAIVTIHTFTLKFHQSHTNWHSIERVQFKFHPNYKTKSLFLENFDLYFSFPTHFFHFFNQKNWDKIRNVFFFWVGIQQFFPFCWKFSPIFWYHKFSKEKNHPFTTTFFYLHTLINSTLLYSNWKKAFVLARVFFSLSKTKEYKFTWEKKL